MHLRYFQFGITGPQRKHFVDVLIAIRRTIERFSRVYTLRDRFSISRSVAQEWLNKDYRTMVFSMISLTLDQVFVCQLAVLSTASIFVVLFVFSDENEFSMMDEEKFTEAVVALRAISYGTRFPLSFFETIMNISTMFQNQLLYNIFQKHTRNTV